mmetsp:Transcript_66602/g.192337  ORF Transcript_66602/g.192337 Transcript_66602/m.192337 type:complete len:294 (-) Transcript_66602:281-1162(-)
MKFLSTSAAGMEMKASCAWSGMFANGTRFEYFQVRSAPADPYCTVRSVVVSTSTWTLHSSSVALAMTTTSMPPALNSFVTAASPSSSAASLTNFPNFLETARSARGCGWNFAASMAGNSMAKSRPLSLSHWFEEASWSTNMRYFWQSGPVSVTLPSLTVPSTFDNGKRVEDCQRRSSPAGPYCKTRSCSESTSALTLQEPWASLANTATSTPWQLQTWCFAAASASRAAFIRFLKTLAPCTFAKLTMKFELPFFNQSLGFLCKTNWKPFTPASPLISTLIFLQPCASLGGNNA